MIAMTETYQSIAQKNLEELEEDIPKLDIKLQRITIKTQSNWAE